MQNFVKIGDKNFSDVFGPFLDHCAAKKIFLSDFNEILRGSSQKYGYSKHQKKCLRFLFFGPFFDSVRERTVGRPKFLLQNFLFTKKINWCEFETYPYVRSKSGF